MNKTYKMILTAMMAALTCVATYIIKVPTPTMGYIHPGDGFVLLSGLLLGPLYGAFAAGLGSALSDFIGGYMIYVPGTFCIKALTAALASIAFSRLQKLGHEKTQVSISGILGELFMVLGYFIYETFLLGGSIHLTDLSAGAVASLASVPANLVQGAFGVVIAILLYSPFHKLSKSYSRT